MTPETLLGTLSPPERRAVTILKTSLDSYNSADGVGLFTGVGRYSALEARVQLAAYQARTLREWWSALLRKMLWPTPPKAQDETLLELLVASDPEADDSATLRALAGQTPSLLMVARFWHDTEKKQRGGFADQVATQAMRDLFDSGDDDE